MSIDSFLNLQHDEFVKKFDVAAVVIVAVITIFELIMGNGTFCQASGAIILLATRVGTPLSLEEPFKASGSGLPWYRIVVTMATLCYLITVLLENKEHLQNFSLKDTVREKIFKRTSRINQDPEQGEELQSRRAELSVSQNTDLDRSVLSPVNSNPAAPPEEEALPVILQVAAYQPPATPEIPSVIEEVGLQPRRLPSRLSCCVVRPALLEHQDTKCLVSPFCQENTRVQQDSVSQSDQKCPRLAEHSESVSPTQEEISQTVDHSNGNGEHPHGNTSPPHGNGEQLYRNGEQPRGNGEQPHANVEQPHANAEQLQRIGKPPHGNGEQLTRNGEHPHGNGEHPHGNGEQLHANAEQLQRIGKHLHGNEGQPHGNGEKLHKNGEQLQGNGEQPRANAEQPPPKPEQPQ